MKKFLRCMYKGKEKFGYIDADKVVCLEGNYLHSQKESGEVLNISNISWLPPVVPSQLVAIGLNYRAHAEEAKLPIPEQPVSFLKSPTSITAHDAEIIYPEGMSKYVDYEAELAVVIGKSAYKVSESEALDYVFGYTCANDVSARDIQKRDGQWMLAKSFKTFNPLGPCIVNGISPSDLRISSKLNGETRQDSRTSDMIFGIPYIIHFLSQVFELIPGDVIITGTPAGVGRMKPGDTIEVEIENIGVLKNIVVPMPKV